MKKYLNFTLALLVYILIFWFALSQLQYHFDFSRVYTYKNLILKGWFQTITISLVALVFSMVFGLFIYFLRSSKNNFFSSLAIIYTELMFGTPLLVLVIIGYYILGTAYRIDNPYVSGIMILTLYISSYISEIYRAGINSIPNEQWDAIKVLGFNKFDTYRYLILPQVFKNVLPPLTSQFANLIKSSSLLSYIGLSEFFNVISQVQTNTFASIESYLILAIGYLVLTIPLSYLIKKIEVKMRG